MSNKLKKRTNWEQKFNGMNSIYNEDGTLNYDQFEGFDQDTVNDAILKARQRGWGSVHIGNQDYTLYKKNNNGIIKEDPITDFDPNEKYSESQLAVYNWNNRKNPKVLERTNSYSIYKPVTENLTQTPVEDTSESIPQQDLNNQNNNADFRSNFNSAFNSNYNLLKRATGRKANFSSTLGLFENQKDYFNNNDVARNMNHYYGSNWNDPSYQLYNRRIDPKESMKNTLGYIYGNENLTKDRMGKTQDYLAMESSRLDRLLGDYNFSYRDMLNYFRDNLDAGNQGKYIGNPDKFMQELYELGASKNGMQGHELQRLFGKDYKKILDAISNNSNEEIFTAKNGGILKMLFI